MAMLTVVFLVLFTISTQLVGTQAEETVLVKSIAYTVQKTLNAITSVGGTEQFLAEHGLEGFPQTVQDFEKLKALTGMDSSDLRPRGFIVYGLIAGAGYYVGYKTGLVIADMVKD